MSLIDRCKTVFGKLAGSPARLPSRVRIPMDRVDDPARLGDPLERDKVYFQVRVNEMFLAKEREWASTYHPMVYVGTEFTYDGASTAIPFVIGPSTLGPAGGHATKDILFSNTRVAGVSPYRGGRLTITLVLYKVESENYARAFLDMAENLAKSLDFATAIQSYTKIAGALLDGIEALTGAAGTIPVVGHRIELDPDAGDPIAPGYFALIDMPDDTIRDYTFWVEQDKLMHGPSRDALEPFRDADYVLHSIASTPRRSDINLLPFYDIWRRVGAEAANPTVEGFRSAKANMASLYQTMLKSPDLIRSHAHALADEFVAEMKITQDRAVANADLGSGMTTRTRPPMPDDAAPTDRDRADSLSILDI